MRIEGRTPLWKQIVRLIYRLHQPTGDFLYNAKYFFERGWYGWAENDVWDVAATLDTIIPELLEHLKKTKHGVPISMLSLNTYSHSEEEIEEGSRKFDAILDEIIEGFKLHKRERECSCVFEKKNEEIMQKKLKKSFELLYEHWDSIWD